jgi:hypothetical protein
VRWYDALQNDAERQLQVCLVLGIEPPESVDPKGAVKARWKIEQQSAIAMGRERAALLYPPSPSRPWYWPHEERIGNPYRGDHHEWPVCYPHDWLEQTRRHHASQCSPLPEPPIARELRRAGADLLTAIHPAGATRYTICGIP